MISTPFFKINPPPKKKKKSLIFVLKVVLCLLLSACFQPWSTESLYHRVGWLPRFISSDFHEAPKSFSNSEKYNILAIYLSLAAALSASSFLKFLPETKHLSGTLVMGNHIVILASFVVDPRVILVAYL